MNIYQISIYQLAGSNNNDTCHWWESQSCSTWARLVNDRGRSRSLTEYDPNCYFLSVFCVKIQYVCMYPIVYPSAGLDKFH